MTAPTPGEARRPSPESQAGEHPSQSTTEHDVALDQEPILLHEEVLEPVVRDRVRGRAVVRKRVETVDQGITVDLRRQHAAIERRPVGKEVETPPPARWEGDTWVLPLIEEEIVIHKRLVLREEVRITIESVTERRIIPAAIRREVVEVTEESDPPSPT